MNEIFKNKYDVTTGVTKAVSELAKNNSVRSESKSNSHSLSPFNPTHPPNLRHSVLL